MRETKLNGKEPPIFDLKELFNQTSIQVVDKIDVLDFNTNIHSDDMQEIIADPPSWILKWGIILFTGILTIIIVFASFIHYPELIRLPVKFQTFEPPAIIHCKTSCTINQIFVKKGQFVNRGQLMLITTRPGISNPDSLRATQDGKLSFISIICRKYHLREGQEILKIYPESSDYFGIIEFKEALLYKIKPGEHVSVRINSALEAHPELMPGKIADVTDEPDEDGTFKAKVLFDKPDAVQAVFLKSWMRGQASIIIKDHTIFDRLLNAVLKGAKPF